MFSFDPETQEWATREAPPITEGLRAVEGPDGKMYCFGFDGTAYVYDPALDGEGVDEIIAELRVDRAPRILAKIRQA